MARSADDSRKDYHGTVMVLTGTTAAERAIGPRVVMRKITHNQSTNGSRCPQVPMSIREACNQIGENFYGYVLDYLNSASG